MKFRIEGTRKFSGRVCSSLHTQLSCLTMFCVGVSISGLYQRRFFLLFGAPGHKEYHHICLFNSPVLYMHISIYFLFW